MFLKKSTAISLDFIFYESKNLLTYFIWEILSGKRVTEKNFSEITDAKMHLVFLFLLRQNLLGITELT